MAEILVSVLVALSSAIASLSPQTPHDRYARHTYHCQQCRQLGAELCEDGEQLRQEARDAGGPRDPRLDP